MDNDTDAMCKNIDRFVDLNKRLGFKVPNQEVNDGSMSAKEAEGHIVKGPLSNGIGKILDGRFDSDWDFPDRVAFFADRIAFDLLYNTLLEVGDIIQRGIRDGTKGHKRALLKAQEKLRGVE